MQQPDRPDLRHVRFREDADMVEHWVWEPNATEWTLKLRAPRSYFDQLAERFGVRGA